MSSDRNTITIGSRKSQLALIQTNHVLEKLQKLYPEKEFKIISMSTTGDNILDKALSKIGEKSLFTKELEKALDDKSVDLVVHSLKDLPSTLPPGMVIGAILERDNPYDAVVLHPSHKNSTLATLPENSVVGTSSLRRIAQLKRAYPHLQFKDVRGNLNTRLKKLDEAQNYSALVLAVAGLHRMKWHDRVDQVLKQDECMYAVSQGALAVECRSDDKQIQELISVLHDYETVISCVAERAFLRTLEGGCSVPIAIHSEIKNDILHLRGGVFSLDGLEAIVDSVQSSLNGTDTKDKGASETAANEYEGVVEYSSVIAGPLSTGRMASAEKLGNDLAELLIKQGAKPILAKAKLINDLK